METIELKEGWLSRQMEEVHGEVKSWPAEMQLLRTINASLVKPAPSSEEPKSQVTATSDR